MKRSKLAFYLEVIRRQFLRRNFPLLIDLSTMEPVNLLKLGDCNLTRSLLRCRYIGSGVIIYFLDPEKVDIGAGTELRDYAILEVGGSLTIGENSVVGAYNWFQCSGTLEIGTGVIIGPHSALVSSAHEKPSEASLVGRTPLQVGTIKIGGNSWIGAGVTVLMDVEIGANSTIGTGSLVNRSVGTNVTAFGVPCRTHQHE